MRHVLGLTQVARSAFGRCISPNAYLCAHKQHEIALIERVNPLRIAHYCVNEVICVLQIEERYVMLNEVKHLNAESMRCFAALNMTMKFKET